MIKLLLRAPLALVLLICLMLALLLPSQARAVEITVNVGGTPNVFDVQFFAGPDSFADNAPTLTDPQFMPWWGDQALALDFANAYRNQVPTQYPFDLSVQNLDSLFFAYNNPTPTTIDVVFLFDSGLATGVSLGRSTTESFPVIHFAYVAPAPVPEIDGGALGQGAVILLALWLMLRRRGAGAITSA